MLSNALWIVSQVPITPDLLQEALSKLLRQVPISGCCLYGYQPPGNATVAPVLVKSKKLNMDMKVLETNDWKQVIRTEWKMKYGLYNGPLWRVKLLPNVNLNRTSGSFIYECVVVFSCCHVITDGMSYQRLFGYLLDSKKPP